MEFLNLKILCTLAIFKSLFVIFSMIANTIKYTYDTKFLPHLYVQITKTVIKLFVPIYFQSTW